MTPNGVILVSSPSISSIPTPIHVSGVHRGWYAMEIIRLFQSWRSQRGRLRMVCTSSHRAPQASERSAPRVSGISTSASRAPMVPSACWMFATSAPSALRESTRTRRGRRPAAPARRIPTTLTLTPRALPTARHARRALRPEGWMGRRKQALASAATVCMSKTRPDREGYSHVPTVPGALYVQTARAR